MVIVLRVERLVCGQVQNYKLQTAKLQKAEILKNPKKVSSTQPPPTCGMGTPHNDVKTSGRLLILDQISII